jgi:hexosaminidase
MSLKKILFLTCIILFFMILPGQTAAKDPGAALIPIPEKVEWGEGSFILSGTTAVKSSENKLTAYLTEQVNELTGIKLSADLPGSGNTIILKADAGFDPANNEAYKLTVSGNQVEITGNSGKGIFRGIQTFFQLIDPAVKAPGKNSEVKIPQCSISDKPAFAWRGLNLDCARHFMTKDFVKRYIDILAYYKFNTLHWHLTEDQGWRIEIKKYPKLTEVGAWRKEADGSTYGGFYTQEDIKEIEAYAQSRYINIVPEIEMPGHSLASLSSYPENSCTGGPFEVTNLWGVFKDIYCAGRDSTFLFLQDVLDEVIALFPGEYIHIGGDEAPKDRWKECPKCQARIKAEGLKDEHELQSYFIKRISNYLYSKGKKVIGWGEILEGGLAPGAIVQSWMDFNAAVQTARQKHYTIVSPASHTYLNGSPEDLDLRIAYSFDPVPTELTGEETRYVIGSEVNLWTEMAPQELVDSKLFPRMLALAEVFWSNPKGKNYDEFYSRVQKTYADLTARGIKFGAESKAYFPSTKYDEAKKQFSVEMLRGQKDIDIRYTTDGSEVTASSFLYEEPVTVDKTASIKFAAFKDGQNIGKKYTLSFDFHKALNAKLTLETPYSERYRAAGDNTVLDGVRGTNDFRDANWQGYDGTDFDAVIDLGNEIEINKVIPRFILASNSWIFLPVKVTVSVSADGKNFTEQQESVNDVNQKNSEIILKDYICSFNNVNARYIKVHAENMKTIPEWHPGAGNKAWIFIDEIVVE